MTGINPDEVHAAMLDCMFRNEEIPHTGLPDSVVPVEGLVLQVGFHRERLESYRAQVKDWLKALPPQFDHDVGGGWSFLNACTLADGTQWTDFQKSADELFMLAIGLKMATYLLPRDMWAAMPGGMPYVVTFLGEDV